MTRKGETLRNIKLRTVCRCMQGVVGTPQKQRSIAHNSAAISRHGAHLATRINHVTQSPQINCPPDSPPLHRPTPILPKTGGSADWAQPYPPPFLGQAGTACRITSEASKIFHDFRRSLSVAPLPPTLPHSTSPTPPTWRP